MALDGRSFSDLRRWWRSSSPKSGGGCESGRVGGERAGEARAEREGEGGAAAERVRVGHGEGAVVGSDAGGS